MCIRDSNNVPWAFSPNRKTGAPALYPRFLGLTMTLVFAFCIGYGATIAEPALNAMGITVENLTNGAFKKRLLLRSVAIGVGLGAALGVARILFDLPLAWLVVGAYTVALGLTVFSREEVVNLAWDSAGAVSYTHLDVYKRQLMQMKEYGVKSLVVEKRHTGDAYGLISYRDIAKAVIADDGDIDLLNVYDIAQKPALQVSQHLEVRYLARLMIQYSVKRVLVIDNNELQGFVSITDVVGSLMERALHGQDR